MKRILPLFLALIAGGVCAERAFAQLPRANATQKGSLLVWPEIVIRWNAQGRLATETFVSILNDLQSGGVRIKFYFVNGDGPAPAIIAGDPPMVVERPHPGWNYLDNQIDLTHDQPGYFRASAGQPLGTSPFVALDPGSGNPMDPVFGNRPGRPDTDPANPGGRVLRGFMIAFAIDEHGALLRHNHLAGRATFVDYLHNSAYEHEPWTFKANFNGAQPSDVLRLDGSPTGYDACPESLLFDFFAAGSNAFGRNAINAQSTTFHELTLMTMILDFSPTQPPEVIPTDAQFDVWNEDEVKLTNLHRCIRCWDSTFTHAYPSPNFLALANLGSQKGRARITGAASPLCDRPPNPNAVPPDPGLFSQSAPLIGCHQRIVQWIGVKLTRSGGSLGGIGERTDGVIKFVPQSDPPESGAP